MLRFSLKKNLLLTIILGLMAFLFIGIGRAKLSMPQYAYKVDNDTTTAKPFLIGSEIPPGSYIYRFKVSSGYLFGKELTLVADDCLEAIKINGHQILNWDSYGMECNATQQARLNLSQVRGQKNIEIELKIRNVKGRTGVRAIDPTEYTWYLLPFILIGSLIIFRMKPILSWMLDAARFFLRDNRAPLYIFVSMSLWTAFVISFPAAFPQTLFYRNTCLWSLSLTVILPLSLKLYTGPYFPKHVSAIFLLSTSFYVLGLSRIFYDEFSYDVEGHLEYIAFMSNRSYSPAPISGWMFYHPSLYYRSAAFFINLFPSLKELNLDLYFKLLQTFSLILFSIYCYFSILTIGLFFKTIKAKVSPLPNSIYELLAVSVFLFWPCNSITAIRIGNDSMLNMLFAIGFYYSLKWWCTKQKLFFYLSLVFASLAVWTKSNGFILIGLLISLLVLEVVLETRKKSRTLRSPDLIAVLVPTVMIIIYLSMFQQAQLQKNSGIRQPVVGNASGLGNELRVGKKLKNFLPPAPVTFISTPFTSALEDTMGRQNFWWYLAKTSMFGEFSADKPLLAGFAKIMSLLFVLLLPIAAYGAVAMLRSCSTSYPVAITFILLIGSMIAFRITYPFSCSNDFRYIYPLVLPFCIFIGYSISLRPAPKLLNILLILVISLFILSSFLYQMIEIA